MASFGTVQLAGNANSTLMEVELNTLAARFVVRPTDFQRIGSFRGLSNCPVINAATSPPTSFPTVAFMTLGYNNAIAGSGKVTIGAPVIAVIKRVNISLVMVTAGTGAGGAYGLGLIFCNNVLSTINELTAAGVRMGGGVSFPYGSLVVSNYSGSATPLTTTTPLKPLANVTGNLAGPGTRIGPFTLWDSDASIYPLILEPGAVSALSYATSQVYGELGITLTGAPAFTTSTTVQAWVHFEWDEYTPTQDYW